MAKQKQVRNYITRSFSFPADTSDFIDERCKSAGINPSRYISQLVEFDREDNTLARAVRRNAERLATPAAA